MAKVVMQALAALVVLPSLSEAVSMRRGSVGSEDHHVVADKSNRTSIATSAFSTDFINAVDEKMEKHFPVGPKKALHKQSLVASKSAISAGSGFMVLADHGASQLNFDTALNSFSPPDSVTKLLRGGAKQAQGQNMWKADVDMVIVEKAIINLNGMVFQSQIRLDAKNDECEEFKAKYTETLDQINGDLARMGQELSNTARAITNHMGGIDANILNNQQTKEEMQKEEMEYNEVRNADLIVLKERETNMAVSSFILVFSACPDAPSASSSAAAAAMIQATATEVMTCVNSTGPNTMKFKDPKLDAAAQRLTTEAQDMLMRFIETEEADTSKGGQKIAHAAEKLEAAALGDFESIAQDLDDGDIDGEDDSDINDPNALHGDEEESQQLLQLNGTQDPCGPPVDRIPVEEGGNCGSVPASCCSCNKYFKGGKKFGNNANGWCTFVPELRTCKSGHWLKKPENKAVVAQTVCTVKKGGEEAAPKTPPKSELKSANRCSNAKFDCGVLHDMFAALWGETKDLVDELTYKMNQDTAAFEKVKEDINSLLQTQATQLAGLQSALAEASANKAAQTDEQAAKQKEKVDVTKLFDDTMAECKEVMKEILFTEICGVLAVRNNMIAAHMPGEPTPTDCSVGEWVAGDCSVPCDDELQGGVHQLTREVVVTNTPRGCACPALTTQRKCKQIPCPVACGMSAWSAWGKCTKECGGGVQEQVRSMEVKPANGGAACDATSQSQPCNTGSCDVDCVIGKWMPFKPCTKACNTGYQERRKRMISEKKGDGQCLAWNHKDRLERKPCATQPCTGDETCNSTLELIIAIDSSGSVTEAGFDILKEFSAKIVRRMMSPVQVGVVLFGNGKLDLETNVISDAKVITDNLEGDMEAVAGKIEGMIIHKGFTNMAQGFTKSKDVFTYARKGAATTMLMITDGRPSFKFQTGFAVKALRKSARIMIVQVQANRKQEIAELLRGYVSEPWSANYRHIAGKKKLKGAMDSYVTSVLADMCPKLISPSALTECTDTTGKAASKVYPCECGKPTCKQGEFCDLEGGFCVPPELALVAHNSTVHKK